MRIFALELDNDIRGIEQRDAYVEGIMRSLPHPCSSGALLLELYGKQGNMLTRTEWRLPNGLYVLLKPFLPVKGKRGLLSNLLIKSSSTG